MSIVYVQAQKIDHENENYPGFHRPATFFSTEQLVVIEAIQQPKPVEEPIYTAGLKNGGFVWLHGAEMAVVVDLWALGDKAPRLVNVDPDGVVEIQDIEPLRQKPVTIFNPLID